MSAPGTIAIGGDPTEEEAAAIVAAVGAYLAAATASSEDPRPWAYRSAWRRAAIDEGVGVPHTSSITALGRPMSRPSGVSNDLGGFGVS